MPSFPLKHVVVAGTFDRLHSGHKQLLKTAFACSRLVSCGLIKNPPPKILSSQIQNFPSRQRTIKNFLQKSHLLKKTKIFPLTDFYGPTLKKTTIQAVIATSESLPGVIKINRKRKSFGLKPLSYRLSRLIYTNEHRRLSSTLIRLGQITSQGFSYPKFLSHKNFSLPSRQKKYFQKPIGQLLPSLSSTSWSTLHARQIIKKENPPLVITVGDIATQSFAQHQIRINLAIIDFRFRRQNLSSSFHQNLLPQANLTHAVNPPSTLSANLLLKLKTIFPAVLFSHKLEILQITGEEDLTVLPAVLLSPLNSLLFYGQPNQGLVKVKITPKTKQKALRLLKKFSPYP
jgi:uncharacterized protein (UPF0218 family)/phosphopantetheine adenylyltransferase